MNNHKLIILLVLIILGAMLIFWYISMKNERGKAVGIDYNRVERLNLFKQAINSYYSQNGTFPKSFNNITGMFINGAVPPEPGNSESLEYQSISNGDDYQLCVNFKTKLRRCFNSKSIYPSYFEEY